MKQFREDLINTISDLYPEALTESEVEEACENLLNLFRELIEIDRKS